MDQGMETFRSFPIIPPLDYNNFTQLYVDGFEKKGSTN